MSNVISIRPNDDELMKLGLEKLDDALSYFDEMTCFEGVNLASCVYVAIRYGEEIKNAIS